MNVDGKQVAALGDPTRLSLVLRLRDGKPRYIRELSQGIELTRQGISIHCATSLREILEDIPHLPTNLARLVGCPLTNLTG